MADSQYERAIRGLTLVWALTVPALFIVLALLGLTMRLTQAAAIDVGPDFFYAIMTVHGLGMAGTMFVGGLAAVTYLLARYAQANLAVMWTTYWLTVIGVVGLIVACLIGRFGAGWYLLYPLPFFARGVWPDWSTGLAIVSLIVLGVGWLLGQIELFRVLVARYGLTNTLGWQYFRRGGAGLVEIPPIALITVTAVLVPGILTTIVGAVLLLLYLFQWFSPTVAFNVLLLKNMVFLFGHTLVNVTMYLGVAVVYDLLPKYSGKPLNTNAVIALAWNAVMFLVVLPFFHHLYMDFAQPIALDYIGQIASYASAIPATVVSVFTVISQLYGSRMQWRFVPLCLYLGVIGWVIGGLAAVVDSTIMVNFSFHNTLWVPAHFHTYFLVGYFLMLVGFLYEFSGASREGLAKAGLTLLLVGGYGFLLMFYLGGAFGVPRRYSAYDSIPLPSLAADGEHFAMTAALFVIVLIIGALLMFGVVFGGLMRGFVPSRAAAPGE